jgi:hypothetical protein
MKFGLKIHDQTIFCKELPVYLYKDLLKNIYGDDVDTKLFVNFIGELFSSVTSLPPSFFTELSVINLLSAILQLRTNSVGDRIQINLNREEAKTSLELRLDWVDEDIVNLEKDLICKQLVVGQIEVEIGSPSLQRLTEKVEEEYLYFIKSIKIGDNVIVVKTNQEAKQIAEKLPIKIVKAIIDHFEFFVTKIRNTNLLSRYGVEDQALGFIPSFESLLWFTKLIFNEPLNVFYDNMFYLSKLAHMSPSYIESCTVGEYFLFTGTLQATLAQENSVSSPSEDVFHREAINDFNVDNPL